MKSSPPWAQVGWAKSGAPSIHGSTVKLPSRFCTLRLRITRKPCALFFQIRRLTEDERLDLGWISFRNVIVLGHPRLPQAQSGSSTNISQVRFRLDLLCHAFAPKGHLRMKDEIIASKAVTLLLVVDYGISEFFAFCGDAFFRKRQSLTILGDYAGSGPNDFPRFLAGGLTFVGVNALQRNRIPTGVAGNGVVLAVVVGSKLTIDRLPFRIRPFDSDLDALSGGFVCQCLALRRRARV